MTGIQIMLRSMGLDVQEIERQAGEFVRGLIERLDRLEAQNKEILARLEARNNGGTGQEIQIPRGVQVQGSSSEEGNGNAV